MEQAIEDGGRDGGVFEDVASVNCSWHTFVVGGYR